MSVSLYAIGEEFAALEAALVESGGEWTEEIEARFTALGALETDKVDSYAALCRSQDAYQRSLKDEEIALREKRKVSEALVSRLRSRLQDYMQTRNITELRGRIWKAAIQSNGGLRSLTLIAAPEQLPAEFQIHRIEPNTQKLRELAEENAAGKEDPVTLTFDGQDVARLEARGRSLRFR